MSKVIFVSDEQLDILRDAMTGEFGHWDMYLDFPPRPDLENIARIEQKKISKVIEALEEAQPGVWLTGAEALMLVELLDAFFRANQADMTGQVTAAYLKLKGWDARQAPSEAQGGGE